jgi:hypothetical protein
VNALEQVVAAADPALRPYARPEPPAARSDSFTTEAVYEGFLLHYRSPRVFAGMDPDLSLLAGDSLYALGLERLAEAGDLAGVAALADLISACAQAEAEARGEDADALWQAFSL